MKVVSFHTPAYAEVARMLRADCEVFGLRHTIESVPSLGTWRLNCGMKARFIQEQLEQGESVLWIDADGRIRQPIEEPEGCDFAAWFIPARVMQRRDQVHQGAQGIAAGTMYFAATDASRRFVDKWVQHESGQGQYEQVELTRCWFDRDEDMRTRFMNQGFCKVYDAPWFDGEHPIVVEHFQASRKLKGLA